jgi:hypothetical protein
MSTECPRCAGDPCFCNDDHRLRKEPSEHEPEEEGSETEDAD